MLAQSDSQPLVLGPERFPLGLQKVDGIVRRSECRVGLPGIRFLSCEVAHRLEKNEPWFWIRGFVACAVNRISFHLNANQLAPVFGDLKHPIWIVDDLICSANWSDVQLICGGG